MQAPTQSKSSYRFGLFELDLASRKLLRKGEPVRLQELPFRLLTILLERAGEIVTREELRQSLWPEGTYVEFDGSLNAALKKLRFALGDDADNPVFIETVPKRGYRFIAPVECQQPSDETNTAVIEPRTPALQNANERPSLGPRVPLWAWWVVAGATFALLLTGWTYRHRSQSGPPISARKVIAVLPFSNEGAGPDFDYLRYAIADDLVTDLTYARSVSVRPFASTSRYGSQPADPEAVGTELKVTHVVAGGFLLEKQNLRVSLELVEVAQNQPVWREEVTVSPQDLVALHDKLAARTAQGLLPAMNVADASRAAVPVPKNAQAFALFMHSLSIPSDPEPNRLAIKKLEESVSIDSSYAPAWGELGERYHKDYYFGNGGEVAIAKALNAFKRQSELDPNWPAVPAAIRAEQGDLNGAYDQAADFLRRRPDEAMGHHAMSYVLRSAGLLEDANRECEAALALDPGFNGFRSCAIPFLFQGDYGHAQTYIRLDEHSGFGAMLRMTIALRTGNSAAALGESSAASQGGFRFADLVRMYLNHASEADLRRAAGELETEPSPRDPEMHYFNAAALSFCGESDAALRELQKAIKGNYCSYPAMDKDPLFDPIRQRPEFGGLRQAAIQCQENFLAHRAQVKATLQVSHP